MPIKPIVTSVRDLLQKEQILAARRLLDLVPVAELQEPALDRLRRALAPPTVRSSQRKDGDRTQTFAWLRQHGHDYRGQWVAIGETGLIAAAATLKELRAQLQSVDTAADQPLIHKL